MSFAQSQLYRMHFKNQPSLIVWRKGKVLETKPLPFLEGPTHRAERRESHWPDTDSRLLTEVTVAEFADVISTLRAMGAITLIDSRQGIQTAFREQGFKIDNRQNTASEIRQPANSPDFLEIDSIIEMTYVGRDFEASTLLLRWPSTCNRHVRRSADSSENEGVQ